MIRLWSYRPKIVFMGMLSHPFKKKTEWKTSSTTRASSFRLDQQYENQLWGWDRREYWKSGTWPATSWHHGRRPLHIHKPNPVSTALLGVRMELVVSSDTLDWFLQCMNRYHTTRSRGRMIREQDLQCHGMTMNDWRIAENGQSCIKI